MACLRTLSSDFLCCLSRQTLVEQCRCAPQSLQQPCCVQNMIKRMTHLH